MAGVFDGDQTHPNNFSIVFAFYIRFVGCARGRARLRQVG